MKSLFKAFVILSLAVVYMSGCKTDEGVDNMKEVNLFGKWNLEKYIDIDGAERDTAPALFNWYELGFEFTEGNQFYPRHSSAPWESPSWSTSYQYGPGTFGVVESDLILTYEERSFTYNLKFENENKIVLFSNGSSLKNQASGTWILIKEN